MTQFEALEHQTPELDLAALQSLVSDLLARAGRPISIVEIGSWAGRTALTMSDVDPERVYIYCIDHFRGNENDRLGIIAKKYSPLAIYQTFIKNIGPRYLRRIFPCVGSSEFYAKVWGLPIDMLFIDGDHRFEHVLHDIKEWSTFVTHGGVICGHDFGIFEGVEAAVKHCVDNGPLPDFTVLGQTLWASRMPGAYPNEVRNQDSEIPVREPGVSSSGDVDDGDGPQTEEPSERDGSDASSDQRHSDNNVAKPRPKRSTRRRNRSGSDD